MRKTLLVTAGIGLAVAVFVCAGPAFAQQVPFNGAWVDANAVPAADQTLQSGTPQGDAPAPDWEADVSRSGQSPYAWGTSLWSVYNAGPCDGALRSGTWTLVNCDYSTGSVSLGFPVHIPTGALVQYARIYFRQTVIGDTISAGFWKTTSAGVSSIVTGMSPTATTAGDTYQQFGPFSETMDNAPGTGNTYSFLLINTASTRVYKMMVYYTLQVAPAPATATFTDVPTTSGQFAYVEALVAAGITSGCGTGIYCPDSPVTRGQMAVFLGRALGLSYQY
jgi:hypothetical protein